MMKSEEDELESTLQALLIYIRGTASYGTNYKTMNGICARIP
jgi:hypothetical protein